MAHALRSRNSRLPFQARCGWRRGIAAVALASAAAAAIWWIAPALVEDPLPGVLGRTPVRTWRDRHGRPLYCERTWHNEWRFDIPLDSVPQVVVDVMLATEDLRFWQHGGIDYRAICRAAVQNLTSLRVVSGASTISMQTAAMDYHSGRRSVLAKFIQAVKARKMEHLHSKREILEAYFNNLPFGGNIYGIEAAARFYFGMHASELGIEEASLLCGLPQRPNRLRPDRHPEAAQRRQRLVLRRLVQCGMLSPDEAEDIAARPKRYRDYSVPADFEAIGAAREWGFILPGNNPMCHGDPQDVVLDIDASLTERVAAVLRRRAASAADVSDGAAIILDVATGRRIAYVGTLDFDSLNGGQVDAARSTRSAGSALKPFLFAEAMRGGQLVADSVMLDAPVRYADYRPENAEGGYSGRITATQALSRSLNTPAIRLLAALGVGRVSRMLASLGLPSKGNAASHGLSLALGTSGYRLTDLVAAYSTLVPRRTGKEGDVATPEDDVKSMLAEMLRTLPLPGTTLPVAWKTGTSNNNCDAWCFAYTPDYVVGVWFGNKDGSRSASLTGIGMAAPAAGEIFEILYTRKAMSPWPYQPDFTEKASLCAATGLAAGTQCREKYEGLRLRRIPLALCESCGKGGGGVAIVSPAPLSYRLADGAESMRIDLVASDADAVWFVDGSMLQTGVGAIELGPGRHEATAVSQTSRSSAKVAFTVLPQ